MITSIPRLGRKLGMMVGLGGLIVSVAGCDRAYVSGHAFDQQGNWLSVAIACNTYAPSGSPRCAGGGDGFLGGQTFKGLSILGLPNFTIDGPSPSTVTTLGFGTLGQQKVDFLFTGQDLDPSGQDTMSIQLSTGQAYTFTCQNCFELTVLGPAIP